jgi:hypothetical protein
VDPSTATFSLSADQLQAQQSPAAECGARGHAGANGETGSNCLKNFQQQQLQQQQQVLITYGSKDNRCAAPDVDRIDFSFSDSTA